MVNVVSTTLGIEIFNQPSVDAKIYNFDVEVLNQPSVDSKLIKLDIEILASSLIAIQLNSGIDSLDFGVPKISQTSISQTITQIDSISTLEVGYPEIALLEDNVEYSVVYTAPLHIDYVQVSLNVLNVEQIPCRLYVGIGNRFPLSGSEIVIYKKIIGSNGGCYKLKNQILSPNEKIFIGSTSPLVYRLTNILIF